MSEKADIEISPQEEELLNSEPPKPWRQGVGIKTVGLGVIIASLLGAGGGAMLSQMLQTPAADISPLATNIEALQSENIALKAQVARLQRDIKAVPKPQLVNLKPIQARLMALENAAPQEIDPELVARLEALNADGSEALDLSDILARLETLEKRPIAAVPTDNTTIAISAIPSMPFPEAAILAAIDSAEPSGGWLKRSLKKHISVQSDDNPHYLVEQIVQNLEHGDLEAALLAFDKLPDEAKTAARGWRESLSN